MLPSDYDGGFEDGDFWGEDPVDNAHDDPPQTNGSPSIISVYDVPTSTLSSSNPTPKLNSSQNTIPKKTVSSSSSKKPEKKKAPHIIEPYDIQEVFRLIRLDDTDQLEEYLHHHKSQLTLNFLQDHGSPLMVAAQYGFCKAIDILHKYGAEVGLVSLSDGMTAAHYAANGGKYVALYYLLRKYNAPVTETFSTGNSTGGKNTNLVYCILNNFHVPSTMTIREKRLHLSRMLDCIEFIIRAKGRDLGDIMTPKIFGLYLRRVMFEFHPDLNLTLDNPMPDTLPPGREFVILSHLIPTSILLNLFTRRIADYSDESCDSHENTHKKMQVVLNLCLRAINKDPSTARDGFSNGFGLIVDGGDDDDDGGGKNDADSNNCGKLRISSLFDHTIGRDKSNDDSNDYDKLGIPLFGCHIDLSSIREKTVDQITMMKIVLDLIHTHVTMPWVLKMGLLFFICFSGRDKQMFVERMVMVMDDLKKKGMNELFIDYLGFIPSMCGSFNEGDLPQVGKIKNSLPELTTFLQELREVHKYEAADFSTSSIIKVLTTIDIQMAKGTLNTMVEKVLAILKCLPSQVVSVLILLNKVGAHISRETFKLFIIILSKDHANGQPEKVAHDIHHPFTVAMQHGHSHLLYDLFKEEVTMIRHVIRKMFYTVRKFTVEWVIQLCSFWYYYDIQQAHEMYSKTGRKKQHGRGDGDSKGYGKQNNMQAINQQEMMYHIFTQYWVINTGNISYEFGCFTTLLDIIHQDIYDFTTFERLKGLEMEYKAGNVEINPDLDTGVNTITITKQDVDESVEKMRILNTRILNRYKFVQFVIQQKTTMPFLYRCLFNLSETSLAIALSHLSSKYNSPSLYQLILSHLSSNELMMKAAYNIDEDSWPIFDYTTVYLLFKLSTCKPPPRAGLRSVYRQYMDGQDAIQKKSINTNDLVRLVNNCTKRFPNDSKHGGFSKLKVLMILPPWLALDPCYKPSPQVNYSLNSHRSNSHYIKNRQDEEGVRELFRKLSIYLKGLWKDPLHTDSTPPRYLGRPSRLPQHGTMFAQPPSNPSFVFSPILKPDPFPRIN